MRAKGEGNIRKRPDGRWEARVVTGYSLKTGKPIRKSLYGKTQKEVREKLLKFNRNEHLEPTKLLVRDWIEEWIKTYCYNLSPTTIRSYRSAAANSINPYIGTKKLSDLKPVHIQMMVKSLEEKGLSTKSIKNIVGVLSSALNAALDSGLIEVNPVPKVRLPKVVKPELRIMSDEELQLFIRACHSSDYGNLFLFALYTGMRQGEIIGLRWEQIDFKKRIIKIDTQVVIIGKERFRKLPKHNKVRAISFDQTVYDILMEQQEAHPDEEAVFLSSRRKPLTHTTIYRNFKNLTDKLGIDGLRFHDLRHTHAVLSMLSGADLKTIQTNLGHHSELFTLSTYIHSNQDMIHRSSNLFESYLGSFVGSDEE